MTEAITTEQVPAPAGLGGWLMLVGLGLVVTPLRISVSLLQLFPSIFQDGTWEVLTTPGSEAYDPLWAAWLIFEIVGNIAIVVTCVVLLVLFFNRASQFPKLFIAYVVMVLLFAVGDSLFGSLVQTDEAMFDPSASLEIVRSVIAGFIWIPYMLVSKRVRNTFVVQAAD